MVTLALFPPALLLSSETENAENNKRESTEPVSDDEPKRSKMDLEVLLLEFLKILTTF